MKTIYRLNLEEFEKKNHTILVDLFKELEYHWRNYPLKYNKKIKMDYSSFVGYCYSVTDMK